MIGKIISHYRILEKIGKGGMGEVFLAEDIKLERKVALKFLPGQFSADEEEKKRFIHEAKAASALDHPNICTVHEIGETPEGQLFIAMGYYAGTTLKEKMKGGPLPVSEALGLAMQVAEGLQEAHRKGIVHRDLKPANIMLTEQGVAKIVDFGLAKLKGLTRLTKSGTTLGTVAYMSPEQALGKEVDQRSDIWSLGVILYEMLTGKLPFRGEYDQAILYAVINEEPESLSKLRSDIPDNLRRIVRKALAKDRENRYQSAEEFLKELKQFHQSLVAPGTVAFNFSRFLFRPKIMIPAFLALSILVTATIFYLKHQAKVRWAKEEILPQLERLIAEHNVFRDLMPAYKLAEKAEAYIPHDPRLADIFSKCSMRINIRTEPPGARIFMKEYMAPASEWEYIGVSPIEKSRLPAGYFRWKMEKEGYETVLAAASTFQYDLSNPEFIVPCDLTRILDKKDGIPPGMVRVTGAKTAVGILDDFYIDKYEVTNKQYKDFVIAGGYLNKKFWKQKFVQDGKELTWEEALKAFVDQTGQPGPAGWQAGDFPEGEGEYPVSGISWYEAAAYAEFAGKSLPTGYHWGLAAGRYTLDAFSPGFDGLAILSHFCNFGGKGAVPVGSLPGVTAYGASDMAGNVREWCSNKIPKGRLIRGGAWGDNTYMFHWLGQNPAMGRSNKNGFRCALYPEPDKIPRSAFQDFFSASEIEDNAKQKIVADPVFRVYREQFSYDKTDLQARLESKKETPEWSLEKISFVAAYGNERVMAWLFLPKNAKPPYQTVIYFGGNAPVYQRSILDIENYWEFLMFNSFLVKNGRAVLLPIYKGFFNRGSDALNRIQDDWSSYQWREVFVQQVKDLRRSIDYLETRPDVDDNKLAYAGMSYGAIFGPVVLAVEDRLRACVLSGAGLLDKGDVRPEVHPINYVTRVKTPTLMLNGMYDPGLPPKTSQQPLFALLGTPAERKQWKQYETDHIPPRNQIIKETLAWLDKYLGQVKR